MTKAKETPFSLEENLQELRNLLEKLQDPKLSFDENLAFFKRGSEIIESCRKYLDQSELLVKKLTMGQNGPEETDFE